MRFNNRNIFILLLVTLPFNYIFCQVPHAIQSQYRFKHITVDEGLSHNNIRSICQDSEGFIWIATKSGVNKFDGQTIVLYKNEPFDTNSISSNSVNSIFLDSKNQLWFATDAGLDRYNSDFDNFARFKQRKSSWLEGKIFELDEDKSGRLWIATATGLCAYNIYTSEMQYFKNNLGNPYGIPPSYISKLFVDSKDNVWFSILNKGLGVYKQNGEGFKFFKNNTEDPTTISGDRIEKIYEDSKGNIWLGTFNNGLNKYIPNTNTFVRIIPDSTNNYSTRVRVIFEDMKGNFFIGTRSGLYLKDIQTNDFIPYANKGHKFSTLTQNSITESFIDNTGILWIGTFSGGINYTNLNKKEFDHYKAGKADGHFLSGSTIFAIEEDSKGNLWVGGDDGLNYVDRTTNEIKYYKNNPNDPFSLSYNDIKAIEWDKKGNLWIGTNKGGLNYYNVKTGKFKYYQNDPEDQNSLSCNKIYGLMCDNKNNLWIISNKNIDNLHSSIDILPNGSNKFIHLNEKAFFSIEQDEKGDVYIGGINGFWIFTHIDSTFSYISNDLLIGKVNVIKKDSRNMIWIGSDKGLVRYDLVNKTYLSFYEENGYPIDEVFGILEDDSQNLWVSTNMGLIKIANIVKDISNIKLRVYDSEDGLQSKQFSYNAYYKCKSGELVFGGINGFNTFYPANIVENAIPPKVVITDLKIFNTSIPIGSKVNGRIILKKSISATEEVVLERNQNVFTLEFAALHYADPDKNNFKYKLEGFDLNWQYRKGENNFVTYTNLSAGEYTFLVTAANNDNVWNWQLVKLKIIVLPAWWETWVFRAIVLVALLLLVSFIIFFFIIRERAKMQLVVERMKVTKINELNMLKLKFFTNISHEIRTPLTLILTPLEKLLSKKVSSNETDSYLSIMYRNAKNLQKLIDQLLDFRKLELGNLKLELLQGDIVRFISDIVSDYNTFATEKQIALKFNTFQKCLIAQYDADKIGKILNNLLSNAFKFTGRNGKILVNLSLISDTIDGEFSDENIEQGYIVISVRDTGEGIPEKKIPKIFDRFYQSNTTEEQSNGGTGIGLSYVKELVKIHNGKIFVESKLGKGSKFTFRIPFQKELELSDNKLVGQYINQEHESTNDTNIAHAENQIMLVIDDNPDLRKLIKDHFQESFQVHEAQNGKEGWTETLKIIPDVIICDVMMPDMNGFDFCKKSKNDERTSHIPLLLLTALHSKEHEVKGLASGANDYITKPFDLNILHTKIQNILSIRDSLKDKYSSEITLQPKNIVVSSPDQKFIQKAVEVVEKFIGDPDFDLECFVKEVGVSRMQLYRKLNALTDMTVKEFIRNIRLKRAAQLINQDTMTISEIAYAVGFKDISHFGKCFRQEYGTSPTDYKKNVLSNP